MYGSVKDEIAATLQEIKDAGLYKNERELTSPQSAHVTTRKAEALNFCANNYLGLANDPAVVAASKKALDEWGFGMASVRFICGTQTLHTSLEHEISDFLGTEATILYSSCFDANGGVFEVLFGAERRDHQRRAQPRVDHRRRAAVQGACATATGTPT